MTTPIKATTVNALTTTQRVALALRAGLHVLLYGPPGTGKSWLARQSLLAATNVEPAALVLPEDCAVAELRGHYLPTGQVWQWHDGPLTAALRHGTPIMLDEISHASPEAVTFMHSCLDRTHAIELPSRETVIKKPFCAIATMNDSPDRLRPALRDRFGVTVHVDRPTDEAYSAMMFGELARKDANTTSLRSWANLEQAVTAGLTIEQAAELIFPDRGQDLIDAIAIASLRK